MILTVTPNPALDLTWHVNSFVPGTSHRSPRAAARAGGKGLNVARVLHQSHQPVMAVAVAGGVTGERFCAELGDSGVPHRIVQVGAETRVSATIVDRAEYDRATNVNEAGEALSEVEWRALDRSVDEYLASARCIVASGSLQTNAPVSFFAGLVNRAHAARVRCIIDTSGEALVLAARAGADLVKPNRLELAEATGESDPIRGARALIALGAKRVAVSLGEEGMLLISSAVPELVMGARLAGGLAGNATGAGDAAVAAFALSISTGDLDNRASLTRAVAWSAAAVLEPLAGSISTRWEDLEARVVVTSLASNHFQ